MSLAPFVRAADQEDAGFVRDGKAGFVFSDIRYALAADAATSGACPLGMSRNVGEIFQATPEGHRRAGESDDAFAKRIEAGGRALSTAPDGRNLCMNPEAGTPDPNFRTIRDDDIPVDGIDIDGVDSTVDTPSAGSCPHRDAIGMNGERGIDNQFARAVGCSRSYQSSGQSNTYAIEMLTGAWGILVSLDGVDDIRNDDHVEVGIYANADPIQLSAARDPLAWATYAMDPDPGFRAHTTGRITDGVLTTEPADLHFHTITNSLRNVRPLLRARMRATLSEDGKLSGYLAGYAPVEMLYDYQFGYRSGKNANGELGPLPLRLGTGNGAARVLGYTCPGVYFALYEYADADPDPQTGRCTSLSMQYRFSAIPAFVVDAASGSVNEQLERGARP